MTVIRNKLNLTGCVQGVGFRPFVWNLAQQLNCTGRVHNDGAGLEIQVQGAEANVEQFILQITSQPPPLARIAEFQRQSLVVESAEREFVILSSSVGQSVSAFVSPDIAPCSACLSELFDPSNRRYLYPFINCTHCGPRFTIQTGVPYDRALTTMRDFAMCDECMSEYTNPADRRFHAQPIACSKCGPSIWFRSSEELRDELPEGLAIEYADAMHAIESVRQLIASGGIVAIKGIGGFHLACDATNSAAVRLLRQRKQRPHKPLAVMVRDLKTAEQFAWIAPTSAALIEDRSRPIVLLRKKTHSILADEVSPNSPDVGVFLPYAPLHYLLLQPGEVWVMTSGNLADEPIVYDNENAVQRLTELVDGILFHNRPIHSVCDDSVVRSAAQFAHSTMHSSEAGTVTELIPIRRSRGFAPMPIPLPSSRHDDQDSQRSICGPTILAVGGEIKTAICLAKGRFAYLSQHIGDMGNRDTLLALERVKEQMFSLYRATPELIVADLHPGYISAQWARTLASNLRVPFLQVQHHHAHAASLIAECGLDPHEAMIFCAMDGTGNGSDGAIWGGEFLIANALEYDRVAQLSYAPLPGGDACIACPAKSALAFLYAAQIDWADAPACLNYFTPAEQKLLRTQIERRINTVSTSSLGRLFDAVASIVGLRHQIDYEGQAAVELEWLAEQEFASNKNIAAYPVFWNTTAGPAQLDYRILLRAIIDDLKSNPSISGIAARFHLTIAQAIVEICEWLRGNYRSPGNQFVDLPASNLRYDNSQAGRMSFYHSAAGGSLCYSLKKVGLTGGVFQNALLLSLASQQLRAAGFEVFSHQTVPPSDGGLALGQAMIARARLG